MGYKIIMENKLQRRKIGIQETKSEMMGIGLGDGSGDRETWMIGENFQGESWWPLVMGWI